MWTQGQKNSVNYYPQNFFLCLVATIQIGFSAFSGIPLKTSIYLLIMKE